MILTRFLTTLLLVFLATPSALAEPAAQPSDHWAFRPVSAVTPPADVGGWSRTIVDHFVITKLREAGLSPVGDADRRTLIRRIYFDLLGLPPTPQEIDTFVKDSAPDAYSRLVARLLASPAYGERWGRYWLDLARYSDTAGDNGDYPIPEMYKYRDYVVSAFNSDKPYDRFLREQMAGDLIAARRDTQELQPDLKVATGFIAVARRFGTQPYQYHHLEIEDTIDATGRAILGMTFKCARCHDHKFDPITHRDYYALYGIFDSTQYPFAGAEGKKHRLHLVPLEHTEEEFSVLEKAYMDEVNRLTDTVNKLGNTSLSPLRAEVETLRAQLKKAKRLQKPREEIDALQKKFDVKDKEIRKLTQDAQDAIGKLHDDNAGLLRTTAFAVSEDKPVDSKIHLQGNPKELGELVKRNAPAILLTDGDLQIPEGESGRHELAQWISSPKNPLTARVMVNRIWRYHFGRGLVETPSNFGISGVPPTHPRLLDWLAGEFVNKGWSIKAMHRLLLLSRTYQLAGEKNSANNESDPGNKFYWRFRRRQLDAEAIRDSMLAISDDLDRSVPGEHPFPPMKTWNYSQHNPYRQVHPSNHRSVYLMTQRIQRHPYLAIFDGADTNQSTGKRTESIVPQQALFLMNHPFVRERAAGLARKLLRVTDENERIALAYEWAWGRRPTANESRTAEEFIMRYREQALSDGAQPADVNTEAWQSFARLTLTANEFLYVD